MIIGDLWRIERHLKRLRELGVAEQDIEAVREWMETGHGIAGRPLIFGSILRALVSAAVGFITGGPVGAAIAFATTLGFGLLNEALAPDEPRIGNVKPFDIAGADRTQQLRQAITHWRIWYGEARVSGPIVFADVTADGSTNNAFLHLVIVVAAHEVESIDAVYLDDVPIYTDEHLDGSGFVTGHPETRLLQNRVRIKTHLGTAAQTADSDLVSESSRWTSTHRLRERAYVYVRVRFVPGKIDQVPNISVWGKGRKLLDPRDSVTRWSPNAALVWYDYITDTAVGMGATAAEVASGFDAQADICDEIADVLDVAETVTAVDASTDTLEFGSDLCPFQTGDRAQVSVGSPGTLPAGLSASTDYFVIVKRRQRHTFDGTSTTVAIRLATTLANARAGTQIDITSAGSGTITVTKNAEPRYEAAGLIETDQSKDQIIEDILSSMAGRGAYAGSTWNLQAGAYETPTVNFDESDIVGGIRVSPRLPARQLFNSVKGVFVGPQSFDQPTDYPLVSSSTAVTEDGETIIQDIDYPLTSRASAAQRLAWIALNRVRQQISVEMVTNLSGLQVRPGNVVTLDNTRMGWSSKPFEVTSWALRIEEDRNGMPILVCPMVLRETASTVFTFTPGTDESPFDPAPNTNLQFRNVTAPTSLMLASGSNALLAKGDGTVVSRIKVTWTDPPDAELWRIETQFKRTADADYEDGPAILAGVEVAYISDVEDGTAYDVRVRAVTTLYQQSDYAEITNHTVVGKVAVPQDVPSLEMFQLGEVVTFEWGAVPDNDLAGYVLKYAEQGSFVYATALLLTEVTRGTLITNAGLPAGAWTVGIKAVDTTGNESTNAQTANITVTSTLSIVAQQVNAPYWRGTLTNMVRHDVSGTLVPTSSDSDSTGNNFDVFDNFVLNVQTTVSYETAVLDAGSALQNIRASLPRTVSLGPGETGSITTTRQLDYKDETLSPPAFDGFETWEAPATVAGPAQEWKAKISITTTSNVPFLSRFNIQLDNQPREESAANVAVAAIGTTITFDDPFGAVPAVDVTAVDTGSPAVPVTVLITAQTITSFTVQLFRSSDQVAVAGTINWRAKGA